MFSGRKTAFLSKPGFTTHHPPGAAQSTHGDQNHTQAKAGEEEVASGRELVSDGAWVLSLFLTQKWSQSQGTCTRGIAALLQQQQLPVTRVGSPL